MMKTISLTIAICLLVFTIGHFSCQMLDPIPITKFSTFIEPSNVSYTSATVKSKFMDIGEDINTYGHCWDTLQNPTIDNFKTVYSETPQKQVEFASELDELYSITKYYVRAYVVTYRDTIYSNEINFSTIPLSDINGNNYKVVKIGTQLWMAENLKTTRYNNGTDITYPTDLTAWANNTTGAYAWFNNAEVIYKPRYGALYNWHAVNTGKLCPAGWHVPTDDEWTTLEIYLQNHGYNYDGTIDTDDDRETNNKIAKSLAGSQGWGFTSTTGAVGNTDYSTFRNKTGFSALAGGFRTSDGAFDYIGDFASFWSSSANGSESAWGRQLYYDDVEVNCYDWFSPTDGFSVRCLKD